MLCRLVHSAGVARIALLIGRVRRLSRSSRRGGAPGERQDDEERGKASRPVHQSPDRRTHQHRQQAEVTGAHHCKLKFEPIENIHGRDGIVIGGAPQRARSQGTGENPAQSLYLRGGLPRKHGRAIDHDG